MARTIITAIVSVVLALLPCRYAAGQDFALSSNAADYAGGTINMEASLACSRHLTATAGVKYNAWSDRQRVFSAGARWWPWNVYSGWWMGGKAQYQEYSTGRSGSPEISEGDRIGASLSGGYSLMLTPHLNLDVGAGLWGGYDLYSVYACRECGRLNASGRRYFLLPNDIIFSLTYIF